MTLHITRVHINFETIAAHDFNGNGKMEFVPRHRSAGGIQIFEATFATDSTGQDAPRSISLNNQTTNGSMGDSVGSLSTVDGDGGSHSYSLVSGPGSNDNNKFSINGTSLKVNGSVTAQASPYDVRIRSTDTDGHYTEKSFQISVVTPNNDPTDIILSNDSYVEGSTSGHGIGQFSTTDADPGDTHTYTLVSGVGSTHNSSFDISNGDNRLKVKASLTPSGSPYSIRVRSTDNKGGSTEKSFQISVVTSNNDPTDIILSNDSYVEGSTSGHGIGQFSTTDADPGDTHTYQLVAGTGSSNNVEFNVVGNELRVATPLGLLNSPYSIRVRSTDNKGGSTEKEFQITVIPEGDIQPTDITLTPLNPTGSTDLVENIFPTSWFGLLATTDLSFDDSHTYTLVEGTGDDDNDAFEIVGGELLPKRSFNYEAENTVSVRVRSTDSSDLSFEKVFTLEVTDVQ